MVAPKPDCAFGVPYEVSSTMHLKLMNWQDSSIPPVDAFVTSKLVVPFFNLEANSYHGSLRTAENQLANAMTKAHDIFCSLGVQNVLYVLEATKVGSAFTAYISFSTSQMDGDGKTYTDKLYILKLERCFLDNFQGALKCLRFVEWMRNYGTGIFRDTIESVVMSR